MDLYQEISFKTSKLITKSYSTSFSIAVSFLPSEKRNAIYSIYGFVRLADEIVDTFHNVDQKSLLENFKDGFYDAQSYGISTNPVLNSFVKTVKKYSIPTHLIDSFLSSMEMDLSKHYYKDGNELKEYIYGSAEVVGLMCLWVFISATNYDFSRLEKPAMKLGSAFQKVNFLRDLNADMNQLNRKYFPNIEINTFNENDKNELIKNIKDEFKEAKEGIKELPGRSKLAVLIAFYYYKTLLSKLELTPAHKILNGRIRISNSKKMLMLLKAMFVYKFTMNYK